MCALGVSEVVGAEESMIPVREWLARKLARAAPAGPVPMIRRGVVMMGESSGVGVVEEVWLRVGVLPFDEAAAMMDGYGRYKGEERKDLGISRRGRLFNVFEVQRAGG